MLAAYGDGMDIYDSLLQTINGKYDTVAELKRSQRSSVLLLRSRSSGKRYVFRRFSGSAEVYKKLLCVSCPNLPRIFEVGEQNGQTAVLEEYIQGDTLSFLLQGGTLRAEEARRIVRQLCFALRVLHELGAVHRDIKPDNVMMRGGEAVLIDFDAARLCREACEQDTQILGTTGYAAPEQYGISQSDARADIYALGVLLNIMLTGEHPSRRLAPGKMGRVVQKCTMTNPEKRYKSVLRLIEAL